EVKKLTPTGRIQRPAYNVCCGISTSQDGSEEDVMFNYDIVDLTQNDDANMNNDGWNESNVNNSSHFDEQFNVNKKDTYFDDEVDTYYDDE
ncbi:1827_t:CDS:2, partial [Cetraspora pellucida]